MVQGQRIHVGLRWTFLVATDVLARMSSHPQESYATVLRMTSWRRANCLHLFGVLLEI
jgi:hypothetical protein